MPGKINGQCVINSTIQQNYLARCWFSSRTAWHPVFTKDNCTVASGATEKKYLTVFKAINRAEISWL